MSEKSEEAFLELFKEKMAEIACANKKLRKVMYSLIAIFGISLLSGIYWAGMINERVNSIASSANSITKDTEKIKNKQNDLILFLARELKYEPTVRAYIEKDNT